MNQSANNYNPHLTTYSKKLKLKNKSPEPSNYGSGRLLNELNFS